MLRQDEVVAKELEASLAASEYGGPHKHCFTCYSFTLCSKQEDYCDFTR